VSAIERAPTQNAQELRHELEELYADYADCLNEERFEDWPGFFVDDCIYKIVPRENFERGLPLALWWCESKGYLLDRVVGIRKTMIYAPRYVRRMMSGVRVLGWEGETLRVTVSYLAIETLRDQTSQVFSTGQQRDRLVLERGRLKFKEKIVVFDSELVPNSLVFPL
jgi:3-phenylpropionate/cinnamic acid dioxygenase small subunit